MKATEIKLEKFEGPLDLLLRLIEREELTITEVSLSEVTEQFLYFLEKMEDDRSENLADFLVIATRLVYLKSKYLLPFLQPDEDEGPDLADQLKIYKQYLDAGKTVNAIWLANRISYGRVEPPVKAEGFVLPSNAKAMDLHSCFSLLLKRLQPINPLPQVRMDHAVSIRQKIDSIKSILKQFKKLNFKQLLSGAKNRTEVIVSFLAILELIKEKTVEIKQDNSFGDLTINKI